MIRKLLLNFLLFTISLFSKIRFGKFSFKIAFIAIVLGFGINTTSAQCTTPTGIRGDNPSCNGYVARWDGSATAFYIDVATSNTFNTGTIVAAYDNRNIGNSNSVNLTGLNPSTTYHFRVRAAGNSCTSGNSATGTFTTLAIEAPRNIRGDNVNCGGYIARWDGSATKFFIDVATTITFDAGTILPAYNNRDVGTANDITITGLALNTNYYFRLRRQEVCGLSGNSDVGTFKTLGITNPTANAASGLGCNDGQMNWNAVSNASGYYFDIAKDAGFTNILPNYNNFFISYANYYVSNLPGGTLYFRVRTTDNCGNLTGYSNTINFATQGPVGGDVSPAQSICSGTSPTTDLTLTGNSSPVEHWQSASDINFTSNVQYIGVSTATLSRTTIGNLNQNTYFRAVTLQTSPNYCRGYSTPVLITVGNSISTASSSPTVCVNTAMTAVTHTTTGFTAIGSSSSLPSGVNAVLSNNILTISGTPTVAGTFNYSIQLNGTCGNRNATGTITVRDNNTAATPSSNPSVCLGTGITAVTIVTTGATGISNSGISGANGLPAGVSASWASNRITISGTPSATGTFNYSIPLTGGCGSVNATGTITVNTNSTVATPSSNPDVCIGTAITTVTIATTAATGISNNGTAGANGLPAGVSASWASNIITITGTPSVAGTFNYSIPLTGCGNINATGTITVRTNTAAAPSSSPNVCIGTGITAVTIATTGATGISNNGTAGANGLPAGVSASWASNTITITGTPSVAGTFNYSIPLTGGCGSVNATGTITVRANNTAATPSSNPTACIGTGITPVTIATTGATGISNNGVSGANGLPAGVSASWASNTITISGAPSASGTFNYSIPLTGGCASVNATGTITVNAAPTITTTPQTKTCARRHITYTTQSGKSNYIWTISGVATTDYRIVARGTTTHNDIVIEWFTAGSKTVSVNYTNSSGCSASAPATYTTEIVILDQGQINGGRHICPGTTLPTLTFNTYANSSIRYPDTSVIVKWQYSDGGNNYIDIPGTAGLTTYTPTSMSGSTRQYRVVVDNGTCTDQSIHSAIDIDVTTAINSQSTDGQSVCQNIAFTPISVTAVGTARAGQSSIEYQWYSTTQNNNTTGSAITGATSSAYTPLSTTVGTLYYYCIVRGQCGTVTSAVSGAFVVNANTSISGQSTGTQTRCVGTAFNSISVTAAGASLTYQWYSNNTTSTSGGTSLGTSNGANTATYTPQSATAGTLYYYCVVSGTCGSLTSGISGAFIVNPLPTISTQPANLTLCENGTGSFSVATSATNPTYLWEYSADGSTNWITTNGVADVSGYNTSSLNLSNTPLSYGGNYVRVTITSGGCSTISNTARLSVNPIATLSLTSGTATQAVCAGTAITSIVYTWGGGATGVNVTGLPAGLILTPDTPNRTLTISGTPTANGTFSVSTTGQTTPCSAVSLGGTITVNPLPSVSPITGGSSSICAGGTTPAFANATSGGTWSINSGTGTATVDASGIVRGGTAGTVTVVYTYSNGTCPNTATIGLRIDANHPAPTAGTPTRPTCNNGAEVLLSGLPASGNLRQLQGTDSVIVPFTSSGGTFTVTGLTPGTYRFAVDNGCALTYSAPVVIEANTYNGPVLGWSYGTLSADGYVDFASDYTIGSDATYCSVTVSNGAAVTVADGKTLTVTKGVHVDSGTLTFENTSSLLQTSTSNTLNTGVINYKRTTPAIRKADYVYWSTPVKNQTLKNLSPATRAGLYYTHEGSGWIAVPSGNTMLPGKGYIIRGPENFPVTGGTPYPATFIGTPNNGHITAGVNGGTFCLIGNPYPSSLDADKFIGDNRTILAGTLYFWTHATYAGTGTTSKYTQDDYVVYNLSGGSGTTPSNPASPAINLGQFIAAGQGFFADIKSSGAVFFDNSMREGGNSNGQFFKPGKEAKTSKLEKHRVWLNLTNQEGAFKQILVGYIEGATDSYEGLYDGRSFDANKYLDFYSVNETEKLTIQGRALPFTDTDTVPLGYKTTITGDFTIAIDQADGNLSTQKIYLEDKKTGTVHDLSQSNYTFSTEPGSFADRFVLRYTNKTLGTGDFENVENGILVSIKNKTIEVLSSKEMIKEVAVYDINGKLLYTKTKVSSNELQISNLQSSNQVLFVKVTLENDFTVSKKIIFN